MKPEGNPACHQLPTFIHHSHRYGSYVGLSVLPTDTLTCRLAEPEIKPPNSNDGMIFVITVSVNMKEMCSKLLYCHLHRLD